MRELIDTLFDIPIKADVNSVEFDRKLLSEIVGLSIPISCFDKTMRKIMRKKSSCTLWFSNKETKIWDGKQYHEVNYRCCPSSHRAKCILCLRLERTESMINVLDGFLEAV